MFNYKYYSKNILLVFGMLCLLSSASSSNVYGMPYFLLAGSKVEIGKWNQLISSYDTWMPESQWKASVISSEDFISNLAALYKNEEYKEVCVDILKNLFSSVGTFPMNITESKVPCRQRFLKFCIMNCEDLGKEFTEALIDVLSNSKDFDNASLITRLITDTLVAKTQRYTPTGIETLNFDKLFDEVDNEILKRIGAFFEFARRRSRVFQQAISRLTSQCCIGGEECKTNKRKFFDKLSDYQEAFWAIEESEE